MKDKRDMGLKSAYTRVQQRVQTRLRDMKENWRRTSRSDKQPCMKRFYDGLTSVYGPKQSGSIPIMVKDGMTLISDRNQIPQRRAEHFKAVVNQPSAFDDTTLADIPQWAPATHMDDPPNLHEITKPVKQLSAGKAPGADSIPAEVFKEGGNALVYRLQQLFTKIWEDGEVHQDFNDAMIIHFTSARVIGLVVTIIEEYRCYPSLARYLTVLS